MALRKTHAVSEILFDKNLNKLLTLIVRSPGHKFTRTEIKKKTLMSKITIAKWLYVLLKLGFVKTEQIGRTILYYANLENPILRQLKIIHNVADLYEIAKNIAIELECEVYLFGSVARGEDTEKSDIDILILGDKVPKNAVMNKIAPLEEKLNRKITFQIFTRLEWAQAAKKDKPFYERVEKDRIKLA